MPYIYHMVPKDMMGKVLYPLNTLKDIYPEAYASHIKKYDNRIELMDQRIDRLDCRWNDVLHCSALNPAVVVEALRKLGKSFSLGYFEIPAEKLEPENTVVYLNTQRPKGTAISQDNFVEYNPQDVGKYAYLPEETIEYFKKGLEAGEQVLMYHLVPHILYKGTIDTKDLEIITV